MPDGGTTDIKRMRLRYAGVCRVCSIELPTGTPAVYERASRTVRCLEHDVRDEAGPTPADEEIAAGVAGSSTRREFERRRTAREDRIRSEHPKLGGLILAATGTPRSTTAWDTGARGEEALGRRLDGLASDSASVRVLHDRRMPGSRANIDHLAVAPAGVFVIDAKKYRGRPRRKVEGGLLRPRVEKLLVGTRDRTPLVRGVAKQVEVVREVVGPDVPVRGVLCFVEADFPLVGGSFTVTGVDVVWPRLLCRRLPAPGPLGQDSLDALHRDLASALPPA